MRPAKDAEPADCLLVAAKEAGFPVSRAQLHRWQQAGLLPRPRQQGLGRGRGTEVLYPPGSAQQLVALCAHRKRNRRLDPVCWALWWDGYPVSGERIRRLFDRLVAGKKALGEAFADAWDPEAGEYQEDLIARLESGGVGRLSDPLLGSMRRRTGKARFPTFLILAAKAAAGISQSFEDDDAEIAAKAYGLDDPAEVESIFPEVVSALDPVKLGKALESSSRAELEAARDELRAVLEWADGVHTILASAMGRSVGSALADALSTPSMHEGLHLVLLWLSVRHLPKAREAYEAVLAALSEATRAVTVPLKAKHSEQGPNEKDRDS